MNAIPELQSQAQTKPQQSEMGQPQAYGVPQVINLLILVALAIIFLLPLLWLISASLKLRSEVFNMEWLPDPIAWGNYVRIWQNVPLFSWFKNSLWVSLLSAITVSLSSALVAFGFSYFRFRGRDALFNLVLASMMLPGAVTMIPVFLIWNRLGQIDSLTPLWAMNLFGSAFYIFMLRQFFRSLPRELFDAARVDGANYLQMWWNIAVPLVRTAMLVVFIFEFKASWTDLVRPLIYLQNSNLYTLTRGLKAILDQFGQGGEMQWEIVLAASVITTIPIILLFFFSQRYFMEGITFSGIKG
jgi:multiple sugar transport system permease protein